MMKPQAKPIRNIIHTSNFFVQKKKDYNNFVLYNNLNNTKVYVLNKFIFLYEILTKLASLVKKALT